MAKAPWIKHFYRERDGETYIFPKSDYLVVGGTHDPGIVYCVVITQGSCLRWKVLDKKFYANFKNVISLTDGKSISLFQLLSTSLKPEDSFPSCRKWIYNI